MATCAKILPLGEIIFSPGQMVAYTYTKPISTHSPLMVEAYVKYNFVVLKMQTGLYILQTW